MSEVDTGAPQEWKKYDTYYVNVDPDQDDRATEIRMFSFKRPHMRAFHCAWFAFFIAFFIWFSIAPLLPEIKESIHLSKQDLWTSNIIGVGGTIFMRFILGPGCDKYGSRILFCAVLCCAAIPVGCTGLINSATGLYVLRLFIGIAGGTFVCCQAWVSRFFAKNVVGAANAITAGWGNLGGGVTHLVMGSLLFPLFKVFFNGDANLAWRYCFIVPAVIAFITGIVVLFISDDAPKGSYSEMKKHGTIPEISAGKSFRKGALNFNSWLLFAQYAACFGVELTMTNGAAVYFNEEFKQSTESAAAIASIFGWMNLFARGLGGYLSDRANARMGMRGRLAFHFTCLFFEGIFIFIFANTHSLGAAIAVLVFFSLFVQFADGTSYSIVPYIDPTCTGSVSGIVGAGGNVGAVVFGLGFRQMNYKNAFVLMGSCVVAISFTTFLVKIKDCSSLILGGTDPVPEQKEVYDSTLAVPQADKDGADDVEVDA